MNWDTFISDFEYFINFIFQQNVMLTKKKGLPVKAGPTPK
jgi:hypothetical protein